MNTAKTNAIRRALPHLIPPALLVGVLALSHLPAAWTGPRTPAGQAAAAFGVLAVPPSDQIRRHLLPGYIHTLRAEYCTAKTLLAYRRSLPLGANTRWVEEAYARNAESYNAIAGVYPEAVGVGIPLRIPTTMCLPSVSP